MATPIRATPIRATLIRAALAAATLLASVTPAGGQPSPAPAQDRPGTAPGTALPAMPTTAPTSTLRVTGIPDESVEERERRFAPLGRYLQAKLGIKVEYVPAADYESTVEGLVARRVDLAWLTALHFLQARAAADGAVAALVQREEDERFRSVFITRSRSGITRLEDLRGKDFVFGAATSATGHLLPRWYLMHAGVDPRTQLAKFFHSGAHEATVNHVAAGRAVAGALNSAAWKRLIDARQVDPEVVQAFFETGRFNDYVWAAAGGLDPLLSARLRKAFLELDPKQPEEAHILDLQRASRYIEVREDDYLPHAEAARAAGLLK